MQKYLPIWFQLNVKNETPLLQKTISSLAPKVLTKREDIEKVQPYFDKLIDTIETKGINNIALTGGYGSGKSTIIKTFKSLNPKYEYLNISLAAFNNCNEDNELENLIDTKLDNLINSKTDTKTKEETKEETNKKIAELNSQIKTKLENDKIQKEELERLLEISILQQIFYHVKPSEIPESRFKRIINIPTWKIQKISIGFVLWVLSTILLIKYDYLDKMNPKNWYLTNFCNIPNSIDWIALIIFIICFLGIGFFSKLFVELFSNSKINKVNIKGELELGDNAKNSVFNEYLEEILYFFEMTHYNVIIIEDLDRFDSSYIFTKLREINILLNNSKLIEREINFIYAIGDDFFKDKKERVKFFEYIIPVIPFINSSNASEQLKTLIEESGLKVDIFPKEFISDITTFIEDIDMRLLTNIFHEFVIYRNTLKPEFIKKPEELFAIITYKNIDPKDFNKLNNKKGKLYELINGKKKYIKQLIKTIDDGISEKDTAIDNIKNENTTNIDELKSIYLKNILLKLPLEALVEASKLEEDFDTIISRKTIPYSYFKYNTLNYENFTFEFNEIQKEVNSNFTYKERVELVKNKSADKINVLKEEILKLKTRKSEITSWELKQIFEEIDLNQYLDNFSNNGLLRNLILNGYINENYNDYISLFHGINLANEDFQFKKNVVGKFYTEYDFKLSKIENLINEIDERHFKTDFILNFDLLDYLAENYTKNSMKYDIIIKLLSNEKERSVEFINRYISLKEPTTRQSFIETLGIDPFSDEVIARINDSHRKELSFFIEKLVKNWNGFWDFIYSKSNYTPEKEDEYLSYILRYGLIDDILSSQNNNTLATAIIEKPHFLSLVKNNNGLNYFGKITKLIEKLNIKFEELENPNDETKELFEYVYNNNYYQINKSNLLQMIKLFGNIEIENDFETSNYTTILQSNCNSLIEYINSNISNYVENVYLKLEQNIYDNEDNLKELLNNENLDDKLKIKIIQKVEALVTDLSTIKNFEIKKQLLIYNKVTPNWKNIIDYYINCENNIDENLVAFLNFESTYSILAGENMTHKSDVFNYYTFREKLLMCNEITDESYVNILKSSIYTRESLDIKELNTNKVVYLTEKILAITKSNYDALRENFADNHIKLIEKDFSIFLEKNEDFETDEGDILMILKSEKITINNRFKYISLIDEQKISDDKSIAKKVGEIIINKSTKIEFNFNEIDSIVKGLDTVENKLKFIFLYFNKLTKENIISLVKSIGYPYNELFFKQHKPLFDNNYYNKELLSKLLSKYMINSFDIDKKDTTKLRAVANY